MSTVPPATDGEQPAEPLGERHERLHRRARLRGREVHRERHELAAQREHDLLGDGLARLVLRLRRRRAEVRGDHDAVELEQRRLGGGLLDEHVERGAGDAAVAHRVGERGFVDDAAAGGVDDPQRRLGVGEQLGVDQPDRVGRLRQVDGEEVGARHELLDRRHEVDAELAGALGAHVRVVGDELHAERVAHVARRARRHGRGRRCRASCCAARRPPTGCGSTGRSWRSRSACGHVARLREQQRDRCARPPTARSTAAR